MNKRPNKLIDKIVVSATARARKDISQWRTALQQAENAETPKRTLLYNLYAELILDAHLSAEMQKRTLAITSSPYALYSQKDGKPDVEKTALISKPWFFDLLTLAMESLFWGHSLIQIGDFEDGEIDRVTLIDRKHVVPEKGLFIVEQSDEKGILYREDKKYSPWLLETGESKNMGLLNKAAPHVLFKRFAQSAWSEFCELFGMPLRVAKTNVRDKESLDRMEDMMINMRVSPYSIIDHDEKLEFIETTKSNGDVYHNLIKLSNAELSKLINGAVTGEDSGEGSRSKEEVGERTGERITRSDKQLIASFINYTVLPKIIQLGYPIENLTFNFEKSKDIQSLWKMTEGLLQHKYVDNDFITNTFGIPVSDKPETAKKKELAWELENEKNASDPFG